MLPYFVVRLDLSGDAGEQRRVIQADIGWRWQNSPKDTFPISQPEPPNDYESEKQKPRLRKENWLPISPELMLHQTAGPSTTNTVFIICTTAARVSSVNTLGMKLDEWIGPLVLEA
ncbi:hypothetical protein BDW66DRAFT_152726 [Aspergillus desertorum]